MKYLTFIENILMCKEGDDPKFIDFLSKGIGEGYLPVENIKHLLFSELKEICKGYTSEGFVALGQKVGLAMINAVETHLDQLNNKLQEDPNGISPILTFESYVEKLKYERYNTTDKNINTNTGDI